MHHFDTDSAPPRQAINDPLPLSGESGPPRSCSAILKNALRFVERFSLLSAEKVQAGFILGQMEKVYLGACPAAMFSIPLEATELRAFLCDVAPDYRLAVNGDRYAICIKPVQTEVWVWRQDRPEVGRKILEAATLALVNPQAAHLMRAALCGIPVHQATPDWNPAP